jgi:hypothetical protein
VIEIQKCRKQNVLKKEKNINVLKREKYNFEENLDKI